MKKTHVLLLSALLVSAQSFCQYFVSTGTSKYVLVEHATGTWGGYGPDGQQNVIQTILTPTFPTAIAIEWHNGMTDSMTIPSDPFCTGTGYISGFPMGTIDRATFGTTVGQSRPWDTYVSARSAVTANFQVDMSGDYNPYTRILNITVAGKALSSLTGTWNLNAIVVEDSISSAGTGYQQSNSLAALVNSCTGMPNWFFGLSSPLPAASYSHMNVARKILAGGGSVWGDVAFSNPSAGTVASRTYSYVVPASFNDTRLKVVGIVQKYGGATTDRVVENAISSRVRLMPPAGATSIADSFTATTSATCAGASFYISTASFYSGLSVKTEFGDGTNVTSTILSGSFSAGYAMFTHSYSTPGTYTIKHTLMAGTAHLDSVTTSYDYRLCNILAARFYKDNNSNCTYDPGTSDFLLSNAITSEIDSNGVPVDTITSLSGFYYTAYGVAGDVYSVKVLSYGTDVVPSCPSTGIISNTLLATSYVLPSYDFAFNCVTSTGHDVWVHSTTRAYTNRLRAALVVGNSYCNPVTGTLKMNFSPKYIYSSAVPAPTSISGTELTWNLSSLSVLTPITNISVSLYHGPLGFLPTFDTVHTSYSIGPITGDGDTSNNRTFEIDTAIGSYDPNYVEVSPSNCLGLGYTDLLYTVGFENMGGDTAHNIYVLDTLDNDLDFSSVVPIVSSHAMNIYRYTSGGFNIVKFDFPHIMLPDSSHHDVCHGMVQYKVRTKNMLTYGNTIQCRAGIYFDANPVVMTNTANNTICDPANVPITLNTNTTSIFPNPVTDDLNILTGQASFNSFVITNTVGQQMLHQEIVGTQTKVSLKQLPAGVYYITLSGDNGTEVRKFVKM